MIWIDYAIIGLAVMGMVAGLLRGFSLESYALGFWLLATFIGLLFSDEFATFLTPYFNKPNSKIAASFATLFMITLTVGSLIRALLGDALNTSELNFLERLGGMLLGGLRSLLAMVILIMLAGLSSLPNDSWWQESKLLPPIQVAAVWTRDHIPSDLADSIHYSPQRPE